MIKIALAQQDFPVGDMTGNLRRVRKGIADAIAGVAGRFFGRDDLGTLAPGSLADVIAVRGDPLTDMSVLRSVDVVVKNGEVVRARVP